MWTSKFKHGNNEAIVASLRAQLSTVRRPTEIQTKKSENTHAASHKFIMWTKARKSLAQRPDRMNGIIIIAVAAVELR